MSTQKLTVTPTSVYSKELTNWVAFRQFCDHVKERLITAHKRGVVVIVTWEEFPSGKLPEATAKSRLEQDLKG